MKKYFAFLSCILLIACNGEERDIVFEDLVTNIIYSGGEQLVADGTTQNGVTLVFNEETDISKISATATITNGIFISSGTNELEIKPEKFPNDGGIRAGFAIRGTTVQANHRVTYVINTFRQSDPLTSIRSTPASVNLSLSTLSTTPNLSSQVSFEALLSNEDGKLVSKGTKVIILDTLEDGTMANGTFSSTILTTDDESKVMGTYSAGFITPGQFVTISVIVLDENGNELPIADSKRIYIN